ncbi:MAG: reverse transcriptase family protein [gamma proteobacterium symbiont of Lucinoma myriamae]|nr:reverse transcriptase family protein [gamma proteobacterium symbiont of Lucinoma myriamae]
MFSDKLDSDIIILNETHACSNDVLNLNGYFCISNCRSEQPSRLRGGVAIFIKTKFRCGIKIVDKTHTDMIWIRISKEFFRLEQDLYICGIYISPSSSSYMQRTEVDRSIFDKLETDIIKYSCNGNVMIMGDMNAHINVNDYDFIHNESTDSLDDFIPSNYSIDNVHRIRNSYLPQVTNDYGKIILDLCIASQLRILNGRTLGDTRGKATFHGYNGSAIDDYCICSAGMLSDICSFSVCDFDISFSDHSPIMVNIQSYFCHQSTEDLRETPKNIIWNDAKKMIFSTNISYIDKNSFTKVLSDISNNVQLPDRDKVDQMVGKFTSVLNCAALRTNPTNRCRKKNKKRKRKQIWYDDECIRKYKHLKYMSRQLSNSPWDKHLRLKLFYEQKVYRKLVKKKHRQYKNKLLNDLMENEKKNPKEFWCTVNDLMNKHKKDPSLDISSDKWKDYFKSLLNMDYTNNFQQTEGNFNFANLDNSILSQNITSEEISKSVKGLKNGKACGTDGISNEMLKIAAQYLNGELSFVFNFILQKGVYPNDWRENIIKPIYKGGGTHDPGNYRGVALSSCFSKLFSKVLFNRLDTYIENNDLICAEQIGFRKNCRTSDHILTLKTLVDKAFKSSKYLFSCFVDLSKAFDTINRSALFHKLKMYNIKGPFFEVIQDMYETLQCSVKIGQTLSHSFSTKTGVKQGCILSPTLFSLYINDLTQIFDDSCDKVHIDDAYISCLMYADDIVLLSNSGIGLQALLDKLSSFCQKWNLKVNLNKTKVIIFNKAGKIIKNYKFTYEGTEVEVVNEYKYLGIIFKPSGTFTHGIAYLCKKASKALFCIRKALISENIHAGLFLKLYEQCVKPILMYCSEVWCPERIINPSIDIEQKYDSLVSEKIQLKFCKFLLGVHKSAVNNGVRAELGIFPLAISGLKYSLNFWLHITQANNNKIVRKAYNESIDVDKGFGKNVKVFLRKINFTHVWEHQSTFSKSRLLHAVSNYLKESYITFWKNSLFDDSRNKINGNKLRTYRKLKSDYKLENYLLSSDNTRQEITTFAKLRLSSHKLQVEEGRYKKIPLQQRICQLCNTDIEDECHFVLNCVKLDRIRNIFFNELCNIVPSFSLMSDSERFKFVLTSNDYDINVLCVSHIYMLYNERNNLLTSKT